MPASRGDKPNNNRLAATMAEQLRVYLSGVYPAQRSSLSRLSDAQLVKRFESLDYYYTCAVPMLGSLEPPTNGCQRVSPRYSSAGLVELPYLPPGAFYRAIAGAQSERLGAFMYSSWSRHPTPVEVHTEPMRRPQWSSSFGARAGPAPSWTNPNALVRYPLHPSGLDLAAGLQRPRLLRPPKVSATSNSSDVVFDLGNNTRVQRLLRLRDGDLMEVEQWGGPLYSAPECPPICGMWGNVYAGTGVFLRVSQPFVSLNKASAIAQMVVRLGQRSESAVSTLVASLRLERQVRMCQTQHPTTSAAVCLAAALFSMNPCPRAGGAGEVQGLANGWVRWARRSTPQAVIAALAQLSDGASGRRGLVEGFPASLFPAGRFGLHWLFGICGKGPNHLKNFDWGWDALLGTLACALGHKTVVLAASSNDNGLLHQEFVDFDVPAPFGWQGIPRDAAATNDMARCLRPFDWAKRDTADGRRAEAHRHQQFRAHLQQTHKFMLGSDEPCELRFGPERRFASVEEQFESCRVPVDVSTRPSLAKACYAWCDGTMSQAYSATSLLQLRSTGGPAKFGRRVKKGR